MISRYKTLPCKNCQTSENLEITVKKCIDNALLGRKVMVVCQSCGEYSPIGRSYEHAVHNWNKYQKENSLLLG